MSELLRRTSEPRRRHKRFAPLQAEVTCTPRDFWAAVGLRRNVAIQLRDVSLGGVQIVVDRELKPGLKTDLLLVFPGFFHPVAVEADVRWCRRDTISLAPRWTAGLTFKRLTTQDEANLVEVDRTYLG